MLGCLFKSFTRIDLACLTHSLHSLSHVTTYLQGTWVPLPSPIPEGLPGDHVTQQGQIRVCTKFTEIAPRPLRPGDFVELTAIQGRESCDGKSIRNL